MPTGIAATAVFRKSGGYHLVTRLFLMRILSHIAGTNNIIYFINKYDISVFVCYNEV